MSILDSHGEMLAFCRAGDGVHVFSYPAGYAGRGVQAREPGLRSSRTVLWPVTDGHGLLPESSMEVTGCMKLMSGVLVVVEARAGVVCRGLGVFTSVGEPGGTVSQRSFCIFADGSPDCCWLLEPTYYIRTWISYRIPCLKYTTDIAIEMHKGLETECCIH
jgi:hypothetical protein